MFNIYPYLFLSQPFRRVLRTIDGGLVECPRKVSPELGVLALIDMKKRTIITAYVKMYCYFDFQKIREVHF